MSFSPDNNRLAYAFRREAEIGVLDLHLDIPSYQDGVASESSKRSEYIPGFAPIEPPNSYPTYEMWRMYNKPTLARYFKGNPDGEPHCLVYSPDGTKLAVSYYNDNDNPVCLLDLVNGSFTFIPHYHVWRPVENMAFTPDGKYLAVASCYGYIVSTCTDVPVVKREFGGDAKCNIMSMAFSPCGSLVACGTLKGTIYLYAMNSIELLASLNTQPGSAKIGNSTNDWMEIKLVSFSQDGRSIISIRGDGTVVVWGLPGTV
ncbi:MAG: WD40 repeat domain-containing protein [Anaerolineae bacterium]